MVVVVSRRSSELWLKLSLHFEDEVRTGTSKLERGGLDRTFVGDERSAVGDVREKLGEKLVEPLEDALFGSTLCSQDDASSGIVR